MARKAHKRTIVDRLFSLRGDYRTAYSTPAGKRVLAHILDYCGVDRTPSVPGDVFMTGVLVGRQDVGREIIKAKHITDEELRRLAENFREEEPEHGDQAET